MTALTLETIVVRNADDVAETDYEDKIVLLHIENGEYYNFNDTGSDLWRALSSPKKVGELVDLIVSLYECTAEQCTPDVHKWLNDTMSKGLVTISL